MSRRVTIEPAPGDDDLGRNWAGNVTFASEHVHGPTSVEDVQRIVAAAHAADRRVHAAGSRHSFSDVADTDGDMISMTALDGVVSIDRAGQTVTVEGGIRYGELSAALHAEGLALHNLPSLPHITVAGAISTATHGSGGTNGNLATAVRAIELVVAEGSLLRLDAGDDRFAGAVVGLGATGVAVASRSRSNRHSTSPRRCTATCRSTTRSNTSTT